MLTKKQALNQIRKDLSTKEEIIDSEPFMEELEVFQDKRQSKCDKSNKRAVYRKKL